MFVKSITGDTVTIAMLSGHAISIPPEGREIPEQFIRAVLTSGKVIAVESAGVTAAERMAMESSQAAEEMDALKIEVIKGAIKAALNAGDQSFLTAAGIPDARKLDSMTGTKVTAAERDRAWAELLAEAQSE